MLRCDHLVDRNHGAFVLSPQTLVSPPRLPQPQIIDQRHLLTIRLIWDPQPPVTLMIGLGGYYVGTTDLITIPDIPTSPYSWAVNQASGVDLIFQVTDASGAVGYIQNIKVGSSTDSSCLSAAAKVVSSTTSSRSTTVQSSMMTSSTNAGYVPATTTSIDYASAVACECCCRV